MRISLSMLRRLSAGILALLLLLCTAVPVYAGDTGTYKINNYLVTLEPQNDGRVLTAIEQQWQVLSGNIPWVTVGLPNRDFEIRDFTGDVSRVSDGSGSGFYGVRVDLNRSYTAGQTFNIKFAVLQGNILERDTSKGVWRIDYTPGWYDRATIDRLQVNLISPVSPQSYTSTTPMPSIDGNTLTWERNNINPGGRIAITVESTDGSFLTAQEPKTDNNGQSGISNGRGLSSTFWIVVGAIVVIGLLIFWRIAQGKKEREAYLRRKVASIEEEMAKDPDKRQAIEEDFKEYVDKKKLQPDEQGRYYDRSYGGYMTPAIWWAVLASQQRNAANPPATPHSSCVSHPSCACACVSCACACACACAGGGAAGCSRKTLHEFRAKSVKRETPSG